MRIAAALTVPLNLLYIVVDDLRTGACMSMCDAVLRIGDESATTELGGPFGVDEMVTPGIDRLMSEGTTFTRAYANVPVCSPSRTSFLTGMRPRDTRTWTIGPYFRAQALNASRIVTVTQALMAAGYNTTGAGKVWHPGTSSGGALSPTVGGDDMPWSWSYPNGTVYHGYWECDQFYNGTVQSTASVQWPGGTGCVQSPACIACLAAAGVNSTFDRSWVNPDCPDTCFPDGLVAEQGLAELVWKASHPEAGPWALFLGMKRPHLNQFAASWAFDLYDNATTDIAPDRLPSTGMPVDAFYQNSEIAGASDVKPAMTTYTDAVGQVFHVVADWKHRELRWAYRSAVSFMDAQVLRVMEGLDRLGLRNTTWTVFHSDHGWSLGEHGEWAKQNCFEEATRVPLIIVPPSGPAGDGFRRNATFDGIVELVDMYPTILDLLGIVNPATPPPGQLAGVSLLPTLQTATADAAARSPDFAQAFSEISRGTNVSPTESPADGAIQGLSVRTLDYRFSAWVPFNYSTARPLWSHWNASWDLELYRVSDNDTTNLARQPQFQALVTQMTSLVQQQWP